MFLLLFSTELPDNLKALFRPVGKRRIDFEFDDVYVCVRVFSYDGPRLWFNC